MGSVSGKFNVFDRKPSNTFRLLGIVIGVVVGLAILYSLTSQHFYILREVSPEQVGVKISGGQIEGVVPAGIYSDIGWFVKLERYSTAAYQFAVNDPEVLTSDQQRVGVTVSGSAFRPSSTDQEKIRRLWAQYRSIFVSDEALQKVMNDLAMQAMKVCVGDRPFQDSVIGSDRDSLRTCVDGELNKLVQPYGLTVSNITVPNVALSPEVQAKLDSITQSRLDTEKAQQDERKAIAEGKAAQAQQEAAIRVEQSKKQEEARQQTILAKLEQERLQAQQVVIAAQKANDLLAAQKEMEIAEAKAKAAVQQAMADNATATYLSGLYAANPQYVALLMAQANASAIKDSDKIIFAPTGEFPYLVLGSETLATIDLPNTTSGGTAP